MVRLFDEIGLSLTPTFVAFTPSTFGRLPKPFEGDCGARPDPIRRAGATGDPLANSTGFSPA